MEEFHFQGYGAILIGFVVSVVVIRLAFVLYWSGRPLRTLSQSVSTLIVLGSGKKNVFFLLENFLIWMSNLTSMMEFDLCVLKVGIQRRCLVL